MLLRVEPRDVQLIQRISENKDHGPRTIGIKCLNLFLFQFIHGDVNSNMIRNFNERSAINLSYTDMPHKYLLKVILRWHTIG